MIKPPLDVSAASRLAGSLQLRDIVCVGLDAKHLATDVEPDHTTALGWETPPVTVFWDLEGDALKVVLPFSLFIDVHKKEGEVEKKVRLAEISIGMRIEYQVSRGDSW